MTGEQGTTLTLDERAARRLLLAQAVEIADTDGKLLGGSEREQIDQAALEATRDPARRQGPEPGLYLGERARRLLAAVENRQPRIAALQHGEPWQTLLAWGLPALALLLGASLERIDNPRQVNMLSPPLLAFLFWNLLVYLGLLLAPLLPRPARGRGLAALLRGWLANAPGLEGASAPLRGRLRADVAAQYRLRWWRVAGALEGWRIQQVLHASAAAWGVGVALSMVLGGLVREYRVGWESTLLDLPQVHAFLRVLFAPVVALLPLEPFSLADLERMHFRSGVEVPREEARRWLGLYLGLLGLLVVLPRGLLALYAAVRRRWLGRAIRIDLREPYFAETLARVSPARVVAGLALPDPDAAQVLLRLLRQASSRPGSPPPGAGLPWTVLETARGDELCMVELAAREAAAAEQVSAARSWLSLPRWTRRGAAAPPPADAPERLPDDVDLVLVAASHPAELEAAAPLLRRLGRPLLVLTAGDTAEAHALRAAAERERLEAEVLPLDRCGRCWVQEAALREAVLRRLPRHKAAGAVRLMQCWRERHRQRQDESLRLLAEPLLLAARESQPLPGGPLSLRRVVDPAEREAGQQAREAAMAALLQRIGQAQAQAFAELLRLHGLEMAGPGGSATPALPGGEAFRVQQSVHAPQAGLAGAASGAAAGATVDLMTGGLTLGAAAALGALIGGGAALAAATWKNRSAPGTEAAVRLSDEMLQALAQGALLQYLMAIHHGRYSGAEPLEAPVMWRTEVAAVVEEARAQLTALWTQARQARDGLDLRPGMVQQLTLLADRVLARLYGAREA
ncbi:DUF3482 domain-containing protein [Ramlibacter tataouinensis]|uniref:Candidate membrane protein n=1 Tax=Ramlibacter tataouinensis (strain ATCC BAA-407 / DSM 14655 / LMG 21543 / TTB310) TaxID=365046 RepID=F5XW35_RAMTT|nr:DUF3482 domain-containing protein [Ramlibacter tataouinensis]AEG94138.1 candidate membrane protein [Ramlibacter tataouinensis TTB310]